MKIIPLILLAVLVAVVAVLIFIPSTKPPGADADITEAVFRYQFQHNNSALQQKAGAYYLSLGSGQDPSDDFMRRFKGHKPPVKKQRECTGGVAGIKDRKTGKRGLLFRVYRIKWINNHTADVEGGYYEDGLSASGNIYRVVRKGRRWVVVSDKLDWIS